MGEQTSQAPYSDIAQRFFLNPMSEKQAARKQAIERAITRQSENTNLVGSEAWKKRETEDINIAFPRYGRELGEQKRKDYVSVWEPRARDIAYNQYGGSFNPYLQGKQL